MNGRFSKVIWKWPSNIIHSVLIREIQIKTKGRYHISPIKLVKLKKIWQHILLVRLCVYRYSHILVVGTKIVKAFWRDIWQYPMKLHMYFTFKGIIPLLGICPEDKPPTIWKYISTSLFIAVIYNGKILGKNLNAYT